MKVVTLLLPLIQKIRFVSSLGTEMSIRPSSKKILTNFSERSSSLRGLNRYDNENHETFTKRQGYIEIDSLKLQNKTLSNNIPESLEVQFFQDENPTIYHMKHKHFNLDNSDGNTNFTHYYWYGENDRRDNTLNIQIIDGRVVGYASANEKTYSFMTVVDAEGDILVQEVNTAALPQEVEPKNNNNEQNDTTGKRESRRSLYDQDFYIDNGDTIDLLCLYTRQSLEGLCRVMNGKKCDERYFLWEIVMKDRCMFAVQQTNSIFITSGVNTKINLVHAEGMSEEYDEDETHRMINNRLKNDNDQMFRDVRDLRDQYNADLVGLMVDNPSSCGYGSFFDKWSDSINDEEAYFVVNTQCATSYFSFAHEIGHAFGCTHNRCPRYYADEYSNGWRDPDGKFRTVMSYDCPGGCKRIPVISTSDPTIQYEGKAVGDMYHDNVRVINEMAHIIANYRRSGHTQSTLTTTSKPTSAPTSTPTSKPTPSRSCNWDESLVEIEVKTDGSPVNLSWSLSDNGSIFYHYRDYNDINKVMKYKSCIKAAICYEFKIYGYGGGGYYKIIEGGDTVLNSSKFSVTGESYRVAVEGTIKHNLNSSKHNKKECKWLSSQLQSKISQECSKQYIRGVCGRTCGVCI